MTSFYFITKSVIRASSVSTGWATEVQFLAGFGIFLFATASRPALDFTQPPIHLVREILSPGLKRPGRDVDQSHLVPTLRMREALPPLLH